MKIMYKIQWMNYILQLSAPQSIMDQMFPKTTQANIANIPVTVVNYTPKV